MAIEIAGIQLKRVHHIETLEQQQFIYHQVPGLQGNRTQTLGRNSVRLRLWGIFYGAKAQDDLEALRQVYIQQNPADFLANIVGQAYFSQVVLERFEVTESAHDPEQFSYALTLAEYVPPQTTTTSTAPIQVGIQADAASFMVNATLPNAPQLGGIPDISNPFTPLGDALTPVQDALSSLDTATAGLRSLFNL